MSSRILKPRCFEDPLNTWETSFDWNGEGDQATRLPVNLSPYRSEIRRDGLCDHFCLLCVIGIMFGKIELDTNISGTLGDLKCSSVTVKNPDYIAARDIFCI